MYVALACADYSWLASYYMLSAHMQGISGHLSMDRHAAVTPSAAHAHGANAMQSLVASAVLLRSGNHKILRWRWYCTIAV